MNEKQHTRLIPVSKWNDYHIYPSQSGIRHLIHNSTKNGFNKVIKRVKKRILIDENAYFSWIEEINNSN